ALRCTGRAYQHAMREHRQVEEKRQAGQVQIAAAQTAYEASRLRAQTKERAASDTAESAYQVRTRVELLQANIEHRKREREVHKERQDEALEPCRSNEQTVSALCEELATIQNARSIEEASNDDFEAELQKAANRSAQHRERA